MCCPHHEPKRFRHADALLVALAAVPMPMSGTVGRTTGGIAYTQGPHALWSCRGGNGRMGEWRVRGGRMGSRGGGASVRWLGGGGMQLYR